MCSSTSVTLRRIIYTLLQRNGDAWPQSVRVCGLLILDLQSAARISPSFCSAINYPQRLAAEACKEDVSLGNCFSKPVTPGTANHRSRTSSNLHEYWELLRITEPPQSPSPSKHTLRVALTHDTAPARPGLSTIYSPKLTERSYELRQFLLGPKWILWECN